MESPEVIANLYCSRSIKFSDSKESLVEAGFEIFEHVVSSQKTHGTAHQKITLREKPPWELHTQTIYLQEN